MDIENFLEDVDRHQEDFYMVHAGKERTLPIHAHNKHQLYYLEGGIAFFNAPNKSLFVPARHFLWIPAGVQHNIVARTSVKAVYNFFIPTSLIPVSSSFSNKVGIYPVTNLLKEMIYHTKDWDADISRKKKMEYVFLLAFKDAVLDVAKNPLPIELPTTSNAGLSEILKYIHRNIEQPLSLNYVAEKFGYSSRSLSRLFQNNITTSFLQYVKLTRVIKSMELLLQTDLSVGEIGFKCGYGNLSSFSYAFQKIAHSSPADFRKNNQN